MNESLKTIRLYGNLGARFGRVHRLAVSSAREAVKALCVLLPGFERELMTAHTRGVVYSVFLGKANITVEQLAYPAGSDDIRIAPILRGSKQAGALQTIVGAIIVVVGAVVNYFFPGSGVPIMQFGLAMMAGGVVQMLVPQKGGTSTQDQPDNAASYNFNGAVNTSAQGNPVPLGYGTMMCGSAVISAGIFAEDQA
ncbi:tail assembly protein [Herbaspirillum sp. 1130]|uniref:tail assembly protein n=1 Tax=Herbaspirillum sp. 1130 TaxID=2806562 RepID=UPI001AEB3C1E|nr:tail assembly protein [Herbaspirillum sp. 1130]MBP1314534.1 putative phage tail protein [Herbaspirillum sp. 1130]